MTALPRPGDPVITPALVAEHGLTPDEFQRLVEMQGGQIWAGSVAGHGTTFYVALPAAVPATLPQRLSRALP